LKLLRDYVTLSTGEVVSKVIGFATFAYLARQLEPSMYGAVEFAGALALFFAMVVDWGLGPIGIRELSKDRSRLPYLASRIPAARLVIAVFAVLTMILVAVWAGPSREATSLAVLFAVALLATPWKQEWLLQGLEMMGGVATGLVIRTMVFAVGAALVVHYAASPLGIGVVEIVAAVSVSAFYLIVQQIRLTPVSLKLSMHEFRELVSQGFSIGVAHIVWAFHVYIPVVLVAYYLGVEETAWFGAAHRLVVALMSFSWLYHFNLFPAISRRVSARGDGLQQLLGSSIRVVAWTGILGALLLDWIAHSLFVTVYGQPFAAAATAFSILIWSVPITGLAGHARWSLIAAGQQRYVAYAQSSGAVVLLIGSAVLMPRFGLTGGAVAVLVANIAVWLVAQGFASVHLGSVPIMAIAARPALLALALGLIHHHTGGTELLKASLLAACFVGCAPLLDFRLFPDFRFLVHAKADVQPASGL